MSELSTGGLLMMPGSVMSVPSESPARAPSAPSQHPRHQGKQKAKIVYRKSRRSSLPMSGKGMWAAAANSDGVIVPQAGVGNLSEMVTGAEEELAEERAIRSEAAEEAHAIHEATKVADAQASRASHRRMSVGLHPMDSPMPSTGSGNGSPRAVYAAPAPSSGWWAAAANNNTADRPARRGQLLPAAAAAVLDMSQSPRDNIAARGGFDVGDDGEGQTRASAAAIMRPPAHAAGRRAAGGGRDDGTGISAGVSFSDSKNPFDESQGRGSVMGTPLGPELRKSALRSRQQQQQQPQPRDQAGRMNSRQQLQGGRSGFTASQASPMSGHSRNTDGDEFGSRGGGAVSPAASGPVVSRVQTSVMDSSLASGRVGPKPSREVARILEDTMRKQNEAAAQKRVRELRKAEIERRRALTISRHLQRQVEQAEEKVREAAKLEAARATRKARQDAKFASLMGSIDTGAAMCKQLGRDVLDKHDEARRKQQEEMHSQWQSGVYERLQTAIASEVDRVPAAVRRRELLEQSEAYNREAEHGAVFVDSSGGGKTGYNPFKHSRAPVPIRGGRIRDPVKTGIERERREAALTLQARLPAAAAIALGMSGAARRAGIPDEMHGNQHTSASGRADLSRTAFDVALSRPGGVGPGASRMKAVRLPPRHDAPPGSTSVMYVPAAMPTAPISTSRGGGRRTSSGLRQQRRAGRSSTRRPQSGDSARSSASRSGSSKGNRPPSAHSAAKALLRAEQGSIGVVAATIKRVMGAEGKEMSDQDAIEIERAVRQTKARGAVETRWTLPAGVWTSGLIEDMPFVRNWPLPGDPRSRASDAARGRGPTLGRKHDLVMAAVVEGEAAVARGRERVLPSYFAATERDHGEATKLASAELGRPGRRTVRHTSAARRSIQDLLPVGMSQLDEA